MKRRAVFFAAAKIVLAASTVTAVYAADQWYQQVCHKCGWRGTKSKFKYDDTQCIENKPDSSQRCGGLVTSEPCSPPG